MGRSQTVKLAKAQQAYDRQQSNKDPRCGTGSVVIYSADTAEVKILPTRCKRWTCPDCKDWNRWRMQERARQGRPQRHVMLTIKPQPSIPLPAQIKWLKKQYSTLVKKIRRCGKTWEYMYAVELTEADTPHLHIMQRGSYISHRLLKRMWSDLTGAWVVWIGEVYNSDSAAFELTKHCTKSAENIKSQSPETRLWGASKGWTIPTKDDDSTNDGPTWRSLVVPVRRSQLAALLEDLGATVTRPDQAYSPWIVSDLSPPPAALLPTAREELNPCVVDDLDCAVMIATGYDALEREKAWQLLYGCKRMTQSVAA